MSESLGLGKIITAPQQRDAIHVAVAPVVAVQDLVPGQHVGLRKDNGEAYFTSPGDKDAVGIVDPFLTSRVRKGEKFWLFLYPNTVTSLRHEWTHPALDQQQAKQTSKAWLEEFAEGLGSSLESLQDAMSEWSYSQDYAHGDRFAGHDGFEFPPAFWKHYQIFMNVKLNKAEQPSYFSCSC